MLPTAKAMGVQGLLDICNMLVQDSVKFSEIYRSAHHTNTPAFLVCHSMGTLVVLLALKSIPDSAAVVLSGCTLFSGQGASSLFGANCLHPITQLSVAVSVARLPASVSPPGDAAPIIQEDVPSDLAERERSRRDPRIYHGSIMNHIAHELLKMVAACKAAVPGVRAPFLCLHGADDQATLPKGLHFLHAGTSPELKAIEVLPGVRHDVFRERPADTARARAIQRAVAFVESFRRVLAPQPPPPPRPPLRSPPPQSMPHRPRWGRHDRSLLLAPRLMTASP